MICHRFITTMPFYNFTALLCRTTYVHVRMRVVIVLYVVIVLRAVIVMLKTWILTIYIFFVRTHFDYNLSREVSPWPKT